MFIDIHGYPWISTDIHGSMKIDQQTSMDLWILIDPCIFMDIHGYPWTSMDINDEPGIIHGPVMDIQGGWVGETPFLIFGGPVMSCVGNL
jgi:hypothetical protein